MLNLLKTAGEVADITSDIKRKSFMGAVAIRKDGVLVKSRNGLTIRPDCKSLSAHAEIRVLRKAGYGATVYVARVNKSGQFAMAKPCVYCMASLRSRGVDMVYWTVSNNEWNGCKP